MKEYGISRNNLLLFNNYLSNRKQCVHYSQGIFNLQTLKTGVPRGSVLGPLLFFIYTNDFPRSSTCFKFTMYADGTTLSCNLNNMNKENASLVLNTELKHVSDWLACNKLSLDIDKTKFNSIQFKSLFHTYMVYR